MSLNIANNEDVKQLLETFTEKLRVKVTPHIAQLQDETNKLKVSTNNGISETRRELEKVANIVNTLYSDNEKVKDALKHLAILKSEEMATSLLSDLHPVPQGSVIELVINLQRDSVHLKNENVALRRDLQSTRQKLQEIEEKIASLEYRTLSTASTNSLLDFDFVASNNSVGNSSVGM